MRHAVIVPILIVIIKEEHIRIIGAMKHHANQVFSLDTEAEGHDNSAEIEQEIAKRRVMLLT